MQAVYSNQHTQADEPMHSRPWWRDLEIASLVVLVLAAYFVRLTATPVCGEESRWANVAREMIATGDWIVPRQQGTIFPERPPLGSWAIALVGLARGQVDLVAIRLPSALATLATVLLIYAYGRRRMSRFVGFAAAAAYATFGQVLVLGRLGESEALFTFFTAAALLVWHAIYATGRATAVGWCLGYALAALAALVKGPQAPVYFVAASGAYLVYRKDWRWLFSWGHAAGLTCFAAIVGAWLVPFAATNLSAVDDIWAGLAQDRFTFDGLFKHLATYPAETFGCLLPWSPLLLVLLQPQARKAILATRPETTFLLLAVAVTYPTVWFAAGARGRYFMPLYPCLALVIGIVIEHCTAAAARLAERRSWRVYQRVMAIVVAVLGVAVVLAGIAPVGRLATMAQSGSFLWIWIGGVFLAASTLVWASGQTWTPRPQLAILALCGFVGLAQTGLMINVRLRAANELEPVVADLKQQLATGELVSLGRVYHRFAYAYGTPIRQIPWPESPEEIAADVEYFCFDRRPTDTEQFRSTSDGRQSTTTPGTLPFDWEIVAQIACDPTHRDVHSRTVVIGRVRRPDRQAQPLINPPVRR